MMRAQLDDFRARGEPPRDPLRPEETIYGRYGYGLATLNLGSRSTKSRNAFRPVSSRRRCGSSTREAASPAPVYDASRASRRGCTSAAWWEPMLADPRSGFGGARSTRRARGRRQSRGLRDLPAEREVRRPRPRDRRAVDRGRWAAPEATVSLWRFLLDIDWTKTVAAPACPSTTRCSCCSRDRTRAADAVATGYGSRLVDVGRRCRRGRTRGRRSCSTSGRVLPVERRPVAGRAACVSRTDAAAHLALDVADLGSVYLGGFTFRELLRAAVSRSSTQGAIDARTRSSVRTSRPGAPRSSERPGRCGSRAPVGCRRARSSRPKICGQRFERCAVAAHRVVAVDPPVRPVADDGLAHDGEPAPAGLLGGGDPISASVSRSAITATRRPAQTIRRGIRVPDIHGPSPIP
jgi:hypothetical protein